MGTWLREEWLERPLSGWSCAAGWLTSTIIFVGLTQLFGGPTQYDAIQTIYSTWAIAHGHFACSYPKWDWNGAPLVAPIYPLLAGSIAAVARIGHQVPFPSIAQLGPHCSNVVADMFRWSVQSGAIPPTIRVSYVSWVILLAGVVAFLRASGRGRCGWEPTAAVLVACLPPAFMCIQEYLHPEDLVAVGLALGGLACVRVSSWTWAGALIGLACISQQFALLIAIPLMIIAPPARRLRYVLGAAGSVALIILPLALITSGRVLRAALLGSGSSLGYGGTVLREVHLSGAPLFGISRILPIALAGILAVWALQRLGAAVTEPIALLSLMATSLCFRLVFEQNLLGYYFMAVAVLLVLLDVTAGRIRIGLVAWLGLLAFAFLRVSPTGWPTPRVAPGWIWQIVLVSSALALASIPLYKRAKGTLGRGSGNSKTSSIGAESPPC